MKTIKYILIVALAFSFTSCKKYFEDVNVSENLPLELPLNALLPSTQGQISFAQAGDAARYAGVFTQHLTGASRQFATFQRYSFTENDFDNLWRLNLYGGAMQDLNILINKAAASGNIHYQGVGEIMMAFSLGLTTDLWGDIPYSQAFQGDNQLQPAFDSQQSIYATIQRLLDDGIAHVNATDASILKPGSEDLIYGGDMDSWEKFAIGLKARFHIHLIKVNASSAQSALDALAAGALTSNDDDAEFVYGETETTANPWYQYIQQRDDILYDGFAVQSMIGKNDPRYGVFIDTADVFWGTGYLGPYFANINSPVSFFTYFEQKFIESEAKLRTNDDAGAQAALAEAISASMQKAGVSTVDDSTYQANNVSWTGTFEQKLETLMYEKYIAMFLQPEAWTDWRRTGYPLLTPEPTGVISQIPRRFIYPNSERLYNSNCPQASTLTTPRLWWDN